MDYNFDLAVCLLCGNKGLSFLNNLRDDDQHWAAKCDTCGHTQITSLPSIEEDELYYKNNEMSKNLALESKLNEEQLMYKYEVMSTYQAETITKHIPKNSTILEIGSGYGWVVEKLRDKGYCIEGIEINPLRIELAMERAGVHLKNVNILQIPPEMDERYDCVCMFNLFEHIPVPIDFLIRSSTYLKKGGQMVIEVPNLNSYLKEYSKGFKDFIFFRGHASYFTPQTLSNVIRKAGYDNVQIYGKQTYSVENAIHWVRNNKPFLSYCQIDMPTGMEFINDLFKKKLETDMTSDTLVAIATWKAS